LLSCRHVANVCTYACNSGMYVLTRSCNVYTHIACTFCTCALHSCMCGCIYLCVYTYVYIHTCTYSKPKSTNSQVQNPFSRNLYLHTDIYIYIYTYTHTANPVYNLTSPRQPSYRAHTRSRLNARRSRCFPAKFTPGFDHGFQAAKHARYWGRHGRFAVAGSSA
jgi:hypothetical protein